MGSSVVRTPRLDELARGGTVYPVTYNTSSMCRPSLQTLLTGLYPHEYRRAQSDLEASEGITLHGSEVRRFSTLPRVLGDHGYASFQAGKLWEGLYSDSGFSEGTKTELTPQPNGFPSAGGDMGLDIGRKTMAPVFDFIDRNVETPFYLWFAPMLPHWPFDPSREYTRQYDDSDLSDSSIRYYANITRLDAVVGQLIDHLEEQGLRDRTLIVFLSDNGWEQKPDEVTKLTMDWDGHGKGSIYELGMRTPMIFNWPGRVRAGQVEHGVVSTVDLFQTLMDFAGITPFDDRSGMSLRAGMEGNQAHPRKRVIGSASVVLPRASADSEQSSFTNALYLRDAKWHYVWAPNEDRDWLFNIVDDPHEEREVSAQHAKLVTRLRQAIRAWENERSGPVELYREPLSTTAPKAKI